MMSQSAEATCTSLQFLTLHLCHNVKKCVQLHYLTEDTWVQLSIACIINYVVKNEFYDFYRVEY